jgi:membrane-bound lytic murein transglycosylase D
MSYMIRRILIRLLGIVGIVSFLALPLYASEMMQFTPVQLPAMVCAPPEAFPHSPVTTFPSVMSFVPPITGSFPVLNSPSALSPRLSAHSSKPTSPLPEEKNSGSEIVSDYSSNELAVGAVKKSIALFTERMREKFAVWLSRSGRYLEMMKEILKEKDVPEDIVFLSLIESGFSPNAYSPARAAGYWQFIASTARRYGLEINWWKDERKDPVKSTVAAANYLKDLYEIFGSWNLAMAAYNAGEGKILKALKKAKADDYWSLLKTNQIKGETKNYVPRFIAASLIANSPQTFGFDNFEYHKPLSYDVVTIKSPVDLDVIAECSDASETAIRELNPELRRWCTPPDVSEYTLRIPEGKKETFFDKLSQIPEDKRFTVDIYTVRRGDTFRRISRRTGVPVQVILALNDLEKIIPLKAGKKIYLPPKDKYISDREDRSFIKRVSLKTRKIISKRHKREHRSLIKKASLKTKKVISRRHMKAGPVKKVKRVYFKGGKKDLKSRHKKA